MDHGNHEVSLVRIVVQKVSMISFYLDWSSKSYPQAGSLISLTLVWRTTPAGQRWWEQWGRATHWARTGATTTTPPTSATTRGRPPCRGTPSLLSVPTPLPLTQCCQQHLLPHHPQVGWFSSKSSFWQIFGNFTYLFRFDLSGQNFYLRSKSAKKVFDSLSFGCFVCREIWIGLSLWNCVGCCIPKF